jgi:hypothetical protein
MRPELANKFSVTAWGERMPSSKEMSVSTLPEKVIPVMIRSARTCCTASSKQRPHAIVDHSPSVPRGAAAAAIGAVVRSRSRRHGVLVQPSHVGSGARYGEIRT